MVFCCDNIYSSQQPRNKKVRILKAKDKRQARTYNKYFMKNSQNALGSYIE